MEDCKKGVKEVKGKRGRNSMIKMEAKSEEKVARKGREVHKKRGARDLVLGGGKRRGGRGRLGERGRGRKKGGEGRRRKERKGGG